ncbi:MAG TPA: hypothetical protein VGF23_18730 [Gaiellaceae bacterium]
MTALRVAVVAVLAAAAVLVAILAGDVRSSRSALATGDAVFAAAPSRATWDAHERLGATAESLLGTRDDLALRRALQLYVDASKLHLRLDNATEVESARARAQDALARAARTLDPARRAQALNLLGILAFRTAAGGGAQSQVDAALSDFEDAVRADPRNEEAAYDLELLLWLTKAKGLRVEPGQGGGFGRTGRRGAGGGQPGAGY